MVYCLKLTIEVHEVIELLMDGRIGLPYAADEIADVPQGHRLFHQQHMASDPTIHQYSHPTVY